MTRQIQLIAATRNRAKIAELTRVIGDLAEIVPLPPEPAGQGEPPEGETSIEENAVAKALWWSRAIGKGRIVIATDGGLEIPALGSAWNPVRTKRFAGPEASDLDRAKALLKLAAQLDGDQRRIQWLEVVALARNGEEIARFSGRGPSGLLADDVDPADVAAGGGFWIPAIWRCPEFGDRRLSSLTEDERKVRPDHWREIDAPLRTLLSSERIHS
jgi:XTP/dITP diphosphohydrolase